MKEQGGGITSGTPPRKAFFPEDRSLHPLLDNAAWSQLSDSEWPVSVSCLGFQSLISHSCSQKTYSQVTQSIPSSLRWRMLPLKSSQWRISCDCHTLFPYTVAQLPGQPHKYMTGFWKKSHWQKSYTLIVMIPVGASFKAGLIVVLANCPNQQV